MGLTFKENCPDIRNSGVENVFKKLKEFECTIDLFDPLADVDEIKDLYGISPILKLKKNHYDGVLIAVAHNEFKSIGFSKIQSLCKESRVIFDLKNLFASTEVDLKL